MGRDNSHPTPSWKVPVPRRTPRQARSRETVEILLTAAAQVFPRRGRPRPGSDPVDELARTLVLTVDAWLHHAPAPAPRQYERIRELAARLLA